MSEQPYKSVAGALLFTVVLGPVGLLYSSFWGGVIMILLAIVVFSSKFFFPSLLVWVACSVWGVGAVEKCNKKIMKAAYEKRNSSA